MDRLDWSALAAIVALVVAGVVLATGNTADASPDSAGRSQASRRGVSHEPDLGPEVARIRALIERGSVDVASRMTEELRGAHPYAGAPWMLEGDVRLRRQDLMGALRAYREGVDRDPDYLDRKTAVFQGKKLKHLVEEAADDLERRQEAGEPSDLKRDRKLVHYLMRRIAGSCD